MTVVSADQHRRSTTPNGTMTTLASPTLGGAASSLWWVEMNPDAAGPEHSFAGEVLWSITAGEATLREGNRETTLGAGDTVVLPGGLQRQFVAGSAGFTAIATVREGDVVRADGQSAGVPPWVS